MDIVIENARLRNQNTLYDIGIKNGKFEKITPHPSHITGNKVIDAMGNLVTPPFVDPHVHLDKALISEVVRENLSGTLTEAIEIIWDKKRNYDLEDIIERASKVVQMAVLNGTLFMRTHVDVDTIGGLKPLEALLAVKKANQDIMDLQIVAFPQEGIFQDSGTEKLLKQAMEMGADVVGGMPYNEMTEIDSFLHVKKVFEIAWEFDADIDMHVDETDDPGARTLQFIASETIKNQYRERVTAGHTCALASYDESYAWKVMGLIKKAGMNMITNPVTNLMLQGRYDKEPRRRGLTRVKDLMSLGINVSYGQDCLKDTFYPTFGQADMLEVGQIAAHAIQLSTPKDIELLFDMPTINAAKILRIPEYGIREGLPASLVVLNAPTVQEAFRLRADRLYVIRKGRIIAETARNSKLYRE